MKKIASVLIVLSFLGASISAPAFASVKPGAKCAIEGQTRNAQGKKFTCVKSGKKLVWNKGKAIPLPAPKPTNSTSKDSATANPSSQAPAPSPSPSNSVNQETPQASQGYSNPTVQSSSVEICKIRENNSNRNNSAFALPTGFPGTTTLATKTGTVKWALIPIDFSDLPGEAGFRSRVDDQMKMASDWFETVSEGKFKVEWVIADQWVRVLRPSNEYAIERSDNLERVPNAVKLWNDAMAASDKVFDFSGVQTVNFILPKNQNIVRETLQGFPWQPEVKSVKTNEGSVSSFSVPGKFFDSDNRQYWSYWVHEFGHAMGIPHIGSSREPNAFMNLDIMGNQDGYAKELSGWHRYVAGWLDDERVYCQETSKLGTTELTLVPLSSAKSGIKMSVVKISDAKAIIIESRRETNFSCTMPTKKNGVLVYLYDATKSHGENYFVPVTPSNRANEGSTNCPVVPYPDPHLSSGQSISIEGVKIEVLESQLFDKIRLTKA